MSSLFPVVASNVAMGTVLALLAMVLTRLWRSPQLAHALWVLVLLKLITPPVAGITVPEQWLSRLQKPHMVVDAVRSPLRTLPESGLSETTAAEIPDDIPLQADNGGGVPVTGAMATDLTLPQRARTPLFEQAERRNWLLVAAAIWIAGTSVCVGLLGWRCFQFRRLLLAAEDAAGEVTIRAAELAQKLGLRRCPSLQTVDAAIPPLVWSLSLRPMVLLPERLLAELEPAQREAVIAHELAHIRRGDHLVRWLEVVVLIAFWWNPVAWFARKRLREAEEECCDAWVVWALPEERRSYGQAMLKTIEYLTDGPSVPAFAGSAFGRSFYQRRIEMIMQQTMKRKMSWTAFTTVGLLAMTVLPLSAQTGVEPKQADSNEMQADSSSEQPYEFSRVYSYFYAKKDQPQPGTEEQKPVEKTRDFSHYIGLVPEGVNRVSNEQDGNKLSSARPQEKIEEYAELVDRLQRIVDELNSRTGSDSAPGATATDTPSTVAPDDAFNESAQAPSLEKILKRIAVLEQTIAELQAEARERGTAPSRPAAQVPAGISDELLYPYTVTRSHLPALSVSRHEDEQELQERLLMLDVEAAKTALESAHRNVDRLEQLVDEGAVSTKDVHHHRDALREKEIQLKRAETILELFKLQAKRERELAERRDQRQSQFNLPEQPPISIPGDDTSGAGTPLPGEQRATGKLVRVKLIDANAEPIPQQVLMINGNRNGQPLLRHVGRTDQDGRLEFRDSSASDEFKMALRVNSDGSYVIVDDGVPVFKVGGDETVEITVRYDGRQARVVGVGKLND